MYECVHGCNEQVARWMDEWTIGWMGREIGGWMNGRQIEERMGRKA